MTVQGNRQATRLPPADDGGIPRTPPKPPGAGLTSEEAARRLERFGPNTLPETGRDGFLRRLLRQFANPLIYVLLFALLFDLGLWFTEAVFLGGAEGPPLEAAAIGAILVLNAVLGLVQEYRAEGALARLQEMTTPRVWVMRDGRLQQLAVSDLVPGDLIRLEAGERVPADGITHHAQGLLLDTSILTGESVPTEVGSGEELQAGTLVARGKTQLELTRTGAGSAMGRLAGLLQRIHAEKTPLERRLERFGGLVARAVLLLALVLVLLGSAFLGPGRFVEVLLFAVALAVAAVPEGLPAVLTLTLALGTERMARRRAVVRRLAAVEALGSVTVIATDKTGTLTENRMRVRALDSPHPTTALKAMVLASDAEDDGAAGDPLELALLAHAAKQGLAAASLRDAIPRHSARPFDAAWRFMRVTVREEGELRSYFKGAPEVLLERSAMDDTQRQRWQEKIQAYGSEGYRTLALARGSGERERDLAFLGLVLLWDPARPEVPAAVERARDAGIRVLMMTGDHPSTALSVARTVGVPPGRVLTDTDLDDMSPEELAAAMREANVLARVSPEDKLRVVETLQQGHEIVAVTGDGVNDAPALKRADVGVAMGQRGSDVAREVADLVLMDDNFATIVAAVSEGRGIYANIQKFIRFLFATNLAEVLVVMLGLIAALLFDLRQADGRLLLPLTATQILWINLVTDALPALALAVDRNPDTMRRPPRDPRSPLLDRPSLAFILLAGTFLTVSTLTTLLFLTRLGYSAEEARSATFLTLVVGQLLYPFAARRLHGSPPRNALLLAAVAACILLQLAFALLPGLHPLLQLRPLTPEALLIALGTAVGAWLASEAATAFLRRNGQRNQAL